MSNNANSSLNRLPRASRGRSLVPVNATDGSSALGSAPSLRPDERDGSDVVIKLRSGENVTYLSSCIPPLLQTLVGRAPRWPAVPQSSGLPSRQVAGAAALPAASSALASERGEGSGPDTGRLQSARGRLRSPLLWRLHCDQSGQITAGLIVLLLIFLGMMAFTIDMGFWLLDRRHGQNQVDASVLAGVQELPLAADELWIAADKAQDWLERNSRTDQNPVVSVCNDYQRSDFEAFESPTGNPDSTFAFADRSGDDGLYDTIWACVRRDGLLIFARFLNLTGVTVPAMAAAGLETEEQPSRYALMAMNDSNCDDIPPSLTVSGGAEVRLEGGGESYTALDCGSTRTLLTEGSGTVLDGANHDVCGTGGSNGNPPPGYGLEPDSPSEGVCGVPDPWRDEVQPVPSGCVPLPPGQSDWDFENGDHVTLTPGTYCETIRLSGPDAASSSIILDPGDDAGYFIFRRGLMADGGTIKCEPGTCDPDDLSGVVLYFTCSTGIECSDAAVSRPTSMKTRGCSSDATFCVQGKAFLSIRAPGSQPHIAVWVDRTAVVTGTKAERTLVRLAGQGEMNLDGHVYVWSGGIEIQGTASNFLLDVNGTMLGDTIDIAGQGTYRVTWDDNFPPPFFITTIALVE